jgi:flagellar biosynthesis regulator FlbT
MLFLQYDLPFVTFFIVRCMILNIINAYNVFATFTSFINFTVMLHDWVIFYIKIISRLFLANKGYMAVMLTVRTLINKLRFFELSRMIRNSINEEFTPKRLLVHFFIVER